ncbi:MAG: galactokinase, partial [Anaerolineae bacterium]|nr:galactokinase [Anaerolineae bacterium]
ELERWAGRLDPAVYRRARHVVGENARTLQAAEAMRRGDAPELGRLMNASHISLRDDFEVTGPALDAVVECAWEHPACLGARMTGAGFAGCAIALVAAAGAGDFVEQVMACYRRRTGLEPQAYVCTASAGASATSA